MDLAFGLNGSAVLAASVFLELGEGFCILVGELVPESFDCSFMIHKWPCEIAARASLLNI